MENIWEVSLAALASAVGAFGSVFVLAKYIVRRAIDDRFTHLEKTLTKRLELQAEVAKNCIEMEAGTYATICQLVYVAKNGTDRVRRAKTNVDLVDRDIVTSCRELTEQLHRFRVYLPANIFKALHNYKHLLQDLLIIADIYTRPDLQKAAQELPPSLRENVVSLCDQVAESCDCIIALVHNRIQELHGPLLPSD